ncbi:MAG TPA: hypothetical protein VFI06_12820 [Chitinophagaceae bacterium]|nr:hypothetical protein [Chitinophagaceae bacterium]
MNKPILIAVILFLHFSSLGTAQTPSITITENTFKISALSEEVFYFGLAQGDQLIFDFEEEKGKELKEIEIIELPSSSKFTDYKTKKIENKTIDIQRTGIYKFRFANSSIGGRICKFKLQRIPFDETTRNFNTTISWRTVYDSTPVTTQERYLVRRAYVPKTIIEPSEFYVNSGRNSLFQGGKSRISLPIILPKNTVEWYYSFSASRNKEEITQTKNSFSLIGQLTKLVDNSGTLKISIDMLTKPPGGNVCDVYLLNANSRITFEEKNDFLQYPEGSRENFTSGVVRIRSTLFQNGYLGVKNPDSGYGIHVFIEAVAITMEEEWGVRDVTSYSVSTRLEAYLNQ